MLEFKKILCPVDLDDNGLYALEYTRDIARQSGATVYLLNVARVPPSDMDTPVAILLYPHWEQAARRNLEQIAGERLEGTVADEIMVREGIPETVILEVAAELQIDLIVMVTHSSTGLAHFFLGSLAETAAQQAPCPVLVVPKPDASQPSTVSQKS